MTYVKASGKYIIKEVETKLGNCVECGIGVLGFESNRGWFDKTKRCESCRIKKFRIVFNEERCHYYDVMASSKKSAEKKASEIYYDGGKDKDVKLIDVKPEANNLISCERIE